MRFVKRIICLLLILSCVLFTGCNSILYNGNLKVEPYAPPTLPVDISQKVEKKVEEVQQLELDEKYASVILRRYVEDTGDAGNVYVLRNGEQIPYSELVKEVER